MRVVISNDLLWTCDAIVLYRILSRVTNNWSLGWWIISCACHFPTSENYVKPEKDLEVIQSRSIDDWDNTEVGVMKRGDFIRSENSKHAWRKEATVLFHL